MRVLSLFDGYSAGRLALDRAGIPVEAYYASEIDKDAITISKKNYPDIIHLGSVTGWKDWDIENIDVVIGGSPCQGFSYAGKQLNFNDPRSKLFFEFVDCVNHFKPKYFFLENVDMRQEHMSVISKYLGVRPFMLDSDIVSGQGRVRHYWTNIPGLKKPEDKGIMLHNILEDQVQEKYYIEPKRSVILLEQEVKRRKIGYIGTDNQSSRIYNIHGKSVTLCGEGGGMGAKTGIYAIPILDCVRPNKNQNGQRFRPPGGKAYTLTCQDRHGALVDGRIRILTPTECERLQTLPDGWTEGVTESARYKMLGNGWTVDIIAHCFKNLIGHDDEGCRRLLYKRSKS